jgi:hypothetical protein
MSLPLTPGENSSENLENAELMKSVLPPLLEDFQHWFSRTLEMLETRNVSFLSAEQQQNLLERVSSAQQQVSASQMLASATDGQATIEMPVIMSWNKLVHECWGVSLRSRQEDQKHPELKGRHGEERENKSTEGELS